MQKITGPYKTTISPKRDPLNISEVNFELASFKTLISKKIFKLELQLSGIQSVTEQNLKGIIRNGEVD